MATNLVSSIMQFLTPDLIAKIASLLGLDRSAAQKAIGASIPAILASFTSLASSPDGARRLSSALAQQPAGTLDQFKNAIGGADQKNLTEAGTGLLSGLLGSGGLNALAGAVGDFAGTGTNAGKSLLGLLGPVVAGTLSQQQRNAGLDASGVASLLVSQKSQIAAAMPPGFSKILSGTGLMDAFEGGVRRTAETASAAGGRIAGMADDAVTRTGQAAYAAPRTAPTTWPYWVAALVALLGLGWYLLGEYDGPQVVAERPAAPATRAGETVGVGTPNIATAQLTSELNSSVNTVRAALQGITDPASARAALPKLQQATAQLDKISILAEQLPPAARQGIASSLAPTLLPLNRLFDKILSTPEVAGVAKPTIDALRSKLEALSRA